MIDRKMEKYYDVMLSIFLGIMFIVILNQFYTFPRIITVTTKTTEPFENKNIIDKNNCYDYLRLK